MIQCRHLKKTYHLKNQDVEALKDVSFDIKKGEIYGVIGYSGSGKSTLIRCINLLERPDSGEIIINGKKLSELPEKELRRERTKIGMIFQHFNLLSNDTVFDNVALPLIYQKIPKKQVKVRVEELLELVGLSDKKDVYPSQLSGGQKQRVSIARALANNPEILLSDEATSALDPQTTRSILNLLKELNQKLGLTIVLITHEMAVIKEICSHVAVLSEGRIIEEGSAAEIFSNPRAEITKDFVHSVFQDEKIHGLLENETISRIIRNKGIIARLLFTGSSANEAYISRISVNYEIKASIILGNIEIVQGEPIGCLYLALEGSGEKIREAMQYLRQEGVKVEYIQAAAKREEGNEHAGEIYTERLAI